VSVCKPPVDAAAVTADGSAPTDAFVDTGALDAGPSDAALDVALPDALAAPDGTHD
jgi:hypothetical protein